MFKATELQVCVSRLMMPAVCTPPHYQSRQCGHNLIIMDLPNFLTLTAAASIHPHDQAQFDEAQFVP